MTTFHGVLTFHSETGTEGGAWAFQDEKFMGLDAPPQFRCVRCGRVWDKDAEPNPPAPMFTYWRDDWTEDGKNYLGGYFSADKFDPDGNLGPGEFNQEWTASNNEASRQCAENGHGEWENMYPNGMWSYEGLHILDDGDHLTVENAEGDVIFDDVVQLPPRQDPYAEGAYVAGGGLTAHRRPPVGTDEGWWLNDFRATLTIKDDDDQTAM